ncbi:MAG: hypothetical protein V8Q27_02395 [Eubacteriales bacterium]
MDFENEPVNQAITVVITGKNIEEGPYIWLNTETETAGTSYEDGQALEKNLIFNAVYRTQVHYVKKPFLTTLMLALLGAMFFLVAGGTEKEETGRRASARREKLAKLSETAKRFFRRYQKLLGLGLLLFITALLFLYVYDVQIRKAMNSTHREVVMKDNHELLPVTADTQRSDPVLHHRGKPAGGSRRPDGSGRGFHRRGYDSRGGL